MSGFYQGLLAFVLTFIGLEAAFLISAFVDLTREKARCMRIGNDNQEIQMAARTEALAQQIDAQNQAQQLGVRGVAN